MREDERANQPPVPPPKGGVAGTTLPIIAGARRDTEDPGASGDPARKARSVHLGYDHSHPRWTPTCGCEP